MNRKYLVALLLGMSLSFPAQAAGPKDFAEMSLNFRDAKSLVNEINDLTLLGQYSCVLMNSEFGEEMWMELSWKNLGTHVEIQMTKGDRATNTFNMTSGKIAALRNLGGELSYFDKKHSVILRRDQDNNLTFEIKKRHLRNWTTTYGYCHQDRAD